MRYALILSALAVAATSHASFVLDTFSSSQAPLTLNESGFLSNTANLPSGATRYQHIGIVNYSDPTGESRAISRITSGAWSFSTDDDVTGYGAMEYEFINGRDLSGLTGLKVNFLRLDQDATFEVVFRSLFGYTSGTATLTASQTPFTVFIPSIIANGNYDATNATSITLSVLGPEALDFRVDSIEAVPEPATMAVLGLGVAALARRRRKA